MTEAIIFDLDGTLCNIDHRRHFVENGNKDWANFSDPVHIENDSVNEGVGIIFRSLTFTKYEIICVTGRMEDSRQATLNWFKKFNLYSPDQLIMRKDNDYRADDIMKEEILKKLQGEGYKILLVIDDRQKVVNMWRRNGITCLQCAEGNF